ncbi:MAG: hypothetical protein JKY65_20360 [Planctomycetes bacterium]|nr:hypothetical protein [Planctomycetota bacterium]
MSCSSPSASAEKPAAEAPNREASSEKIVTPAAPAPRPPETETTRALKAADKIFSARRHGEALKAYQAAATAAKSAGDLSSEAEALAQVARMYSLTKRLDEGRPWLEKARALASEDHPWGWTRYLGVRGIFERESGEPKRSLATFAEYHDYAKERGLYTRAIDAAHHAAIVAPPAEQIRWAERGIAAAEAGDERGWLAVLWNNLGTTHEERKDWKAAVTAYTKAKEFHDQTGGPVQKIAAAWALGRAALRAGDLAQAETLLPGCLEQARRGVEGAPAAEQSEWLGFTLTSHGELLVARGRRAAGLAQLKEGRELLVKAEITKWWKAYLQDLDQRIAAASK